MKWLRWICHRDWPDSQARPVRKRVRSEVLFLDEDFRTSFDATTERTEQKLPGDVRRIPIAMWARLRQIWNPYLSEQSAAGGVVLTFYHPSVADYARGRFAKKPDWKCTGDWPSTSTDIDFFVPPSIDHRLPNARKADELVWQADGCAAWALLDRFHSTDFFEAVMLAGLMDGFVADTSSLYLAGAQVRASLRPTMPCSVRSPPCGRDPRQTPADVARNTMAFSPLESACRGLHRSGCKGVDSFLARCRMASPDTAGLGEISPEWNLRMRVDISKPSQGILYTACRRR